VQRPAAGALVDGLAIQGFWKTTAVGYTLMEAAGTGWRATLHPVPVSCTLAGGQVLC